MYHHTNNQRLKPLLTFVSCQNTFFLPGISFTLAMFNHSGNHIFVAEYPDKLNVLKLNVRAQLWKCHVRTAFQMAKFKQI